MLEGFSLGNYLLLVDYAGRLFPEGKAVISAELGAILERLGSSAENWQARLRRLASGRLLRRFFAATRSRLREVAQRLGVHRLANLAGCAARRGGLSPKAVSRLKVPRVARPSLSRCRHVERVSSGEPPNPLDFHISAASNCLSLSSRLPEIADQANGGVQPVWCWFPRRSRPAAMRVL